MKLAVSLLIVGFGMTVASSIQASLINGGFEDPAQPSAPPNWYAVPSIPGWKTTDIAFEIWTSGYAAPGFDPAPVTAYEGNQFAELNAFIEGTLYQDVSGIPAGERVGFEFAHRGRRGDDTMRFTLTDLGGDGVLGGGNDTLLFSKEYTDGNSSWGFYDASAESPIYALGNSVMFAYTAVSAAGGYRSVGNFLDGVDFGVGIGGVAVPDAGSTMAMLGVAIAGLTCLRRKL